MTQDCYFMFLEYEREDTFEYCGYKLINCTVQYALFIVSSFLKTKVYSSNDLLILKYCVTNISTTPITFTCRWIRGWSNLWSAYDFPLENSILQILMIGPFGQVNIVYIESCSIFENLEVLKTTAFDQWTLFNRYDTPLRPMMMNCCRVQSSNSSSVMLFGLWYFMYEKSLRRGMWCRSCVLWLPESFIAVVFIHDV